MQQIIPSKIKAPLLPAIKTSEFVNELVAVCKQVDFKKLKNTFNKFKLQNHPDFIDFINQGEHNFGLFNNIDKGFEVVSTETHESKCSFCSLGKTVIGFNVNYKKNKDSRLPSRIIYANSFAVNLEIKNGYLYEFGWCNSFLSKEQMKQL
ncbi:hypothetical protein [Flavobacterium sp. GT3R68]|uniref:hypothetical protein n=1 Tax=Flavobacterium sp. GT3R68 TaxID=2594437 RepID=UPI000F8880F1|nr:hypothetical protein [Flavobacterium sp. GT3R68]RTY89645.1 hypothetical protein EKL32_22215 [Flavobacterium sp. GSN2]TRW89468.1 hypothetical protein FNW07_13295 [Flavobacterium sp. GT3R68]